MSITITAQFIPQFASERSWRELDRYLTKPDGDWRMLRTYLIREICKHQRTHGIPISDDDEIALLELYDAENPPTSFVGAWKSLRSNN